MKFNPVDFWGISQIKKRKISDEMFKVYDPSDPNYEPWYGTQDEIVDYLEEQKEHIPNYNKEDGWVENLSRYGLSFSRKTERKNVYYVIDTTPIVQSDGFFQRSLGTHTTRSEILETQTVLYEGTNPQKANEVWRRANRGTHRYDSEHIAVIYKGVLGYEGPVVIHKV